MRLVGYLYEDYHDARSLEHENPINLLLLYRGLLYIELNCCLFIRLYL
jgi:hypothetical protein